MLLHQKWISVHDSVLSHNQAKESGGAIYILQSQQEEDDVT